MFHYYIALHKAVIHNSQLELAQKKKPTVYQHEINSDENNEEYNHHVDTNIEDLVIYFTNLSVTKKNTNTHALPQPNGISYYLDPDRYGIN